MQSDLPWKRILFIIYSNIYKQLSDWTGYQKKKKTWLGDPCVFNIHWLCMFNKILVNVIAMWGINEIPNWKTLVVKVQLDPATRFAFEHFLMEIILSALAVSLSPDGIFQPRCVTDTALVSAAEPSTVHAIKLSAIWLAVLLRGQTVHLPLFVAFSSPVHCGS